MSGFKIGDKVMVKSCSHYRRGERGVVVTNFDGIEDGKWHVIETADKHFWSHSERDLISIDFMDEETPVLYQLRTELTLDELKDLRNLLGGGSDNYLLFTEIMSILEKEGREVVEVQGKSYYADDLAQALSTIKEV